jgi:single-strand DNA-binding protein
MNQIRNQVMLIGYLGADPEMKDYENGRKMARVSLATNEVYKNQEGEKVVSTQWHNLVGWGKTAEMMDQLFSKGKEVAIQGKLSYRNFEDEQGNKRQITEVVVNEFVLVGARKIEEIN